MVPTGSFAAFLSQGKDREEDKRHSAAGNTSTHAHKHRYSRRQIHGD